jgi:pimeloyl-ACP methyl ester carboxylesterase
MYVCIARRLATLGFRVVRMDVSGTGDSSLWRDAARNHPYAEQLVADVRATISDLTRLERGERFVLAGLCSGAYVSWHASLADSRVVGLALLNLQTFRWSDDMSLDVTPLHTRNESDYYARRLFAKDAWKKLLAGGVNVRHVVETMRGRARDVARATAGRVMAKLPEGLVRGTDVARTFDALGERGVDVLVVFTGRDPGIDNLHAAVGAKIRSLHRRKTFRRVEVPDSDHSFTPLWAQAELSRILVDHLTSRFTTRSKP